MVFILILLLSKIITIFAQMISFYKIVRRKESKLAIPHNNRTISSKDLLYFQNHKSRFNKCTGYSIEKHMASRNQFHLSSFKNPMDRKLLSFCNQINWTRTTLLFEQQHVAGYTDNSTIQKNLFLCFELIDLPLSA